MREQIYLEYRRLFSCSQSKQKKKILSYYITFLKFQCNYSGIDLLDAKKVHVKSIIPFVDIINTYTLPTDWLIQIGIPS